MAQESVDLIIRGRQDGVTELDRGLASISKRLDDLDRLGEDSNAQLAQMSDLASGAAGGWLELAEGVLDAAVALGEMAQRGQAIGAVERAFQSLAKEPEALMQASREATKGLVSDFELMQAANKGLLMGLPLTTDGMRNLAQAATILGQSMGVAPVDALNRLIGGIGKLETELLDELGITVRAKEAFDTYARSIGTTAENLTGAQKQLAYYNAVVAATEEKVSRLGGVHESAGTAVTRLSVAWDNMADSMAKSVSESTVLEGTLNNLAATMNKVREHGLVGFTQGMFISDKPLETIEEFDARLKAISESGGGGATLLETFGRVENDASKAADKAAKAHEAAAKRANDVWVKAMEDSRKKWDDWGSSMKERFGKDLYAALGQNDKLVEQIAESQRKAAEETIKQLEAAEKLAEEENKTSNEYDVQLKAGVKLQEIQRKQAEEAARMNLAFQGAAMLAGVMGDRFSDMLNVVQNIAKSFEGWGDKLPMDKFGAIAGAVGQVGGLIGGGVGAAVTGAAGGAMAGMAVGGPVGAAIGGVVGLIAGIFGNSKKKAEELKKKQDEAVKSLDGLMDAWRRARTELAETGASGVNKVLDYLATSADVSADQLARGADYVAASFAMLRASGMSTAEALAALKPSLDVLSEKGMLEGSAAEPLAAMANFAAANEGLLGFVEGLGETANALAGFGLLTQELADKIALDMSGAIDEMMAKGLTYEQALAINAQALYDLDQAAKQSGVALDEHTQKMIDDAKAAGLFEGLEDPMKALVEINKALLATVAEVVKLFGGALPEAVQKLIDEFKSAQVPQPGASGGGTAPTTPDGGRPDGDFARGGVVIPRAAHGIVVPSRAGGSLVRMGEAGQPELAAPVNAIMEHIKDAVLRGNEGGKGPIVVNVYLGEREIGRAVSEMTKRGEVRVHPQAVRAW